MGTAGAPKRENHVKGQACLVYKRNSSRAKTYGKDLTMCLTGVRFESFALC